MAKSSLNALLNTLSKADGGISMSIQEFKDAQYGLPLKHYCLQYLFGSTGLRYGGFYMTAGKFKTCKSPFAFWLAHTCCERDGIAFLYELEGKASPTLMSSMFADHPEWMAPGGQFRIIRGMTLDEAEKHFTQKVLRNFQKVKAYDTPLLVDWDSISGSAMSDAVKKIQDDGTAGKGYYEKSHVMKYLAENWSVLIGNLPVIFVGVLQEKEKAAEGFSRAGTVKTYGGGDSQLFKAGTLLSFSVIGNMPNGKAVRIKTALNGFADARQIDTKFVWDQFGNMQSESQGHRWLFAEATARCLAQPAIVGDLRDIIDVKLGDDGLVTCKQFGQTKVTPEEFEAALFADENKETLEQLYRYQKIEKIKTPEEYLDFVNSQENKEAAFKQAEKDAKAEEKARKEAELKAKEEAKQARKEAKAKKQAELDAKKALEQLKKLAESNSLTKEETNEKVN